jgi:hypothetical protein
LRKKLKSKPIVNYPSRYKTRETNKMKLNSKALFHLDIKKENLIIIDDDIVESTEEEKVHSLVTSSYKLKKFKLELEEEHYNESMEKHRKNEKGKQIAEHPMRHVTRETKNLSLKYKSLLNSSLKRGHLTVLEDNLEKAEIEQDIDYFPEIEELQDVQEIKRSRSAKE